jgi:hypothetical protein
MRLRLSELQKLVNSTIIEHEAASELKEEIRRVLGPVIVTEGNLNEVVAAANDRLDVLSRTGRIAAVEFDPNITVRWATHVDPEIRKFVARVCPEKYLVKFSYDKSPEVRAAAAGRMPLNAVREMIKRFPSDDGLRAIFRQKKLTEAGIKQPGKQPMGIDPAANAKRFGDAAKTQFGPELSDAWYREQARRLMLQFDNNIEYMWEETAVRRFCASTKATSGVEIDEAKLLKNVKQLIKEKEDMALERNALKETLAWLEKKEDDGFLTEGVIPNANEQVDPVEEISHLNGERLIEAFNKLFRVQLGMLPLGIRKYRLGEGNARQTLVPVVAILPHNYGFRAIDERVLDAFCEAWTKRQQLQGEPFRLEWTIHPTDANKIGFTCILK